jgi:hypothetical protein
MMILRLHDDPVEHDYTRSFWGHALHGIKIYQQRVHVPWWKRPFVKPTYLTALKCSGFGSVQAMDILHVKMKSGRVARFEVRDVEYEYNPPDMFHIKCAVFLGYHGG